jgi:uncharacterized membrane protein
MSSYRSFIQSLESRRLFTYTLTNLDPIDSRGGAGLENSLDNSPDISNAGAITGNSTAFGTIFSHATLRVVRTSGIKIIDVGNFGEKVNSYARGMNEKSQTIGEFTDSKGVDHAFISTLGKKDVVVVKKLGDVKGISGTNAYAINASGLVVGTAGLNTGKEQALVWTPTSSGTYSIVKLPRVAASQVGVNFGPNSIAMDISDAGVIAGSGAGATLLSRAAIWKKTSKGYVATDLGAIAGGFGDSNAYAINELGPVVGQSSGKDFKPHPVLFALNSKGKYAVTDLGLPAGADSAVAIDINEKGIIVGKATFGSESHAMLWAKNSKGRYVATDLEAQLPAGSQWSLEQPTAINDSNTVIGTGLFQNAVNTWQLTFSGKGYAIKLAAPVSATVQSVQTAAPSTSTTTTKPFSKERIAESVLM